MQGISDGRFLCACVGGDYIEGNMKGNAVYAVYPVCKNTVVDKIEKYLLILN